MLLFLYIFDRHCKFKSHLWKKPLIAVLENDVLKTPRSGRWKFIVQVLIKSANLLKMHFFMGIFQKFYLGFN